MKPYRQTRTVPYRISLVTVRSLDLISSTVRSFERNWRKKPDSYFRKITLAIAWKLAERRARLQGRKSAQHKDWGPGLE